MPTRNVYIRSSLDAKQTAERVFSALSIDTWQERDSDNYPDGFYYLGKSGELEVAVSSDESVAFHEYPFLVTLTLATSSPFNIDEVLDLMVVELLKAGFSAAREVSYKEGVVEREMFGLDTSSNLVKRRDTQQVLED